MANGLVHASVGAVAGLVPDAFLLLFGWRSKWVPESHWAVRAHRFLHGPGGVAIAIVLGITSHILLDRLYVHNTEATWRK